MAHKGVPSHGSNLRVSPALSLGLTCLLFLRERDTRVWLDSEPLFSRTDPVSLPISEYEFSTARSICLFPLVFPIWTNNPGQLPVLLGSVFSWTMETRTCGRLTGVPQKYQMIVTSLGLLHLYQNYMTQRNFTQVYLSAKTKVKNVLQGGKSLREVL